MSYRLASGQFEQNGQGKNLSRIAEKMSQCLKPPPQ